jgi:hypothetical protein
MQKHGGITCTRCTETISMQNREEMGVVVVKWDRQVKKEGECNRRDAQQRNGALKGHGIQCIN